MHPLRRKGLKRQKVISEMQGQIIFFRHEVRALSSNSNLHPRDARTHEVVIGDFGQKFKEGAFNMVSEIIDDKD